MGWKCKDCGTENQNTISKCICCGLLIMPSKVIFISRKTGKSHPVSIKSEPQRSILVGRDILRILDDPDLKYVDKCQFKLEEACQKGILIKPITSAINKVFINGDPVPADGVIVGENDLLSISGKFFLLDLKLGD